MMPTVQEWIRTGEVSTAFMVCIISVCTSSSQEHLLFPQHFPCSRWLYILVLFLQCWESNLALHMLGELYHQVEKWTLSRINEDSVQYSIICRHSCLHQSYLVKYFFLTGNTYIDDEWADCIPRKTFFSLSCNASNIVTFITWCH